MSYSGVNFEARREFGSAEVAGTMNPIVRDMWTDALESDDYPQGRGRLVARSLGGRRYFCCLGVLCDLAVKAGIITYDSFREDFRTYVNGELIEIDSAVLPEVVARWAGLGHGDPAVYSPDHDVSAPLSALNDEHRANFREIAKAIRASL